MHEPLPLRSSHPIVTERERQKIPFKIVATFIRIHLSGILIKFLSLRSRRLCGEIVFGHK